MHLYVNAPYYYKPLLLRIRLLHALMHIKIDPCCMEVYY